MENAHVNNGLFLKVNGQDRLLFFTSTRVVQYAVTAFGPGQLVCDHPFLSGNWDILVRDGQTLLVASPTPPPDADNGYFPRWQTELYVWDDAGRDLILTDSFENVIPHLLPAFREGGKTTSYGSLFPVLRVEEDGEARILLEQQDGQLVLEGE